MASKAAKSLKIFLANTGNNCYTSRGAARAAAPPAAGPARRRDEMTHEMIDSTEWTAAMAAAVAKNLGAILGEGVHVGAVKAAVPPVIVVSGTGDVAVAGGGYAYDAREVLAWVREADTAIARRGRLCDHPVDPDDEYGGCDQSCEVYQRYCDALDPIEDPEVARVVWAQTGVVLCVRGTGSPVPAWTALPDDDDLLD